MGLGQDEYNFIDRDTWSKLVLFFQWGWKCSYIQSCTNSKLHAPQSEREKGKGKRRKEGKKSPSSPALLKQILVVTPCYNQSV